MARKNNNSPLRFRLILDGSGCEYHSLIECTRFMIEVVGTLNVSLRSWTAYETTQIFVTAILENSSLSLHTYNTEVSLNIFSTEFFPKSVIKKAFKYFFKPKELVVGGD